MITGKDFIVFVVAAALGGVIGGFAYDAVKKYLASRAQMMETDEIGVSESVV